MSTVIVCPRLDRELRPEEGTECDKCDCKGITVYCSFCGRHNKESKLIIKSQASYICDECALDCLEMLVERNIVNFAVQLDGSNNPAIVRTLMTDDQYAKATKIKEDMREIHGAMDQLNEETNWLDLPEELFARHQREKKDFLISELDRLQKEFDGL